MALALSICLLKLLNSRRRNKVDLPEFGVDLWIQCSRQDVARRDAVLVVLLLRSFFKVTNLTRMRESMGN